MFSAPLNRPATSAQRLSAVNSSCPSTAPAVPFTLRNRASGEHTREVAHNQHGGHLQGFSRFHTTLHRCGHGGRAGGSCAAYGGGHGPVDNSVDESLSILALRRPRDGATFLPLCTFLEADLSAKRTSTEAATRFPRAHGDAWRSRDPQGSSRQGPEAALGLSAVQRRIPAQPLVATSMRSTGRDGPCRRASSSSTGFPARTGSTSRGSGSRCRRRTGRPSSGIGSSASCARRGARCCRRLSGAGLRLDRPAGARGGRRAARFRVADRADRRGPTCRRRAQRDA